MLIKKLFIVVIFALLLATGSVLAECDPVRGQELAVDCFDCHGEDGRGDEDNPSIAGLDAKKHVELLKGYQSGEIPDEDEEMTDSVVDLTDQDMADLAAYFATLPE